MKFLRNKYVIGGLVLLVFLLIFFNQQIFSNKTLVPLDVLKEFDFVFNEDEVVSQNYLLSDIVDQAYPNYSFVRESLSRGEMPFWNPYILTGIPFFADSQVGFFEFTHLLAYLFNVSALSFNLFSVLITLFIFGFSFYLYLLNLKFDDLVALFGAVVLMFSGTVIVWMNYPLISAFIWLPLLLLCVDKITEKNDFRFLPLFSLVVGLMLFAGYPQVALINLIVGGIYYLIRSFQYKVFKIKIVSLVALFLLFGLGISVVQLGPSWDFIKKSESYEVGRGHAGADNALEVAKDQFVNFGASMTDFMKKSARYGVLAVNPKYYGSPVDRDYRNPEGNPYANFSEVTIYTGFFTIVLALMALFWFRKQKMILFWLLSGIFSFALAVNLPFLNLFKYLPFINKISLSRFRTLFVFSVVMLAVYGLQKIVLKYKSRKAVLVNVFLIILIVVSFGQLFYYFHDYNLGVEKDVDFVFDNDVVKYLQDNTQYERIVGLGTPNEGFKTAILPNESMLLGLYDVRGYNPIVGNSYLDLANVYLSRRGSFVLTDAIFQEKVIDLMSVKYIICAESECLVEGGNEEWINEYENANVGVFRNPNFLPRAYVVYDYVNVESEKVVRALEKADFDPYSQVVVSDVPDVETIIKQSGRKFEKSEISEYSGNRVVVKTNLTESGIMVLTDNYDEDWKVTINGEVGNIFVVNAVFRGVVVPAGENEVVFEYTPKNFRVYLLISIVSLVSLIIVSCFISKKRKN